MALLKYRFAPRLFLVFTLAYSANSFTQSVSRMIPEDWDSTTPANSTTGDSVQDLRIRAINVMSPTAVQEKKGQVRRQVQKNEDTFKILIDPGHGGKDLGAQGLLGISEKVLCLKVSQLVAREIERQTKHFPLEKKVEVELTREWDNYIPLKERVQIANHWGADLFVSIHANSSPVAKARGFEVYFLNSEATDEEATKLARIENAEHEKPLKADVFSILSDVQANHHINESSTFAESLFSNISTKALSRARAVRQGPFTVLHGTTMPAVLIEVGYITNLEDANNLTKDSYLKKLAGAISSGIVEFALKRKRLG